MKTIDEITNGPIDESIETENVLELKAEKNIRNIKIGDLTGGGSSPDHDSLPNANGDVYAEGTIGALLKNDGGQIAEARGHWVTKDLTPDLSWTVPGKAVAWPGKRTVKGAIFSKEVLEQAIDAAFDETDEILVTFGLLEGKYPPPGSIIGTVRKEDITLTDAELKVDKFKVAPIEDMLLAMSQSKVERMLTDVMVNSPAVGDAEIEDNEVVEYTLNYVIQN